MKLRTYLPSNCPTKHPSSPSASQPPRTRMRQDKEKILDVEGPNGGGVEVTRDRDTGAVDVDVNRDKKIIDIDTQAPTSTWKPKKRDGGVEVHVK